jgi:hypothetical protein
MAVSEAMLGYGSRFLVASKDSPDFTYIDMGEIFNITPPSSDVEQVDVTHNQSPDRRREFIDGLIGPGEVSFDMNYIPGSVSDLLLNEILDTPVGEVRKRTCRIIYPNSVIHQFEANLRGYEPSVPTDDKMTATVTWQVTGVVERGTVSSPPV